MRTSALPAAVLSLGLGLALWSAAAWAAGGRELWDVPAFWKMAWPAAMLLCGVLGLAFPERPWRWAALLFAALPVVLLAAGSGFGLLRWASCWWRSWRCPAWRWQRQAARWPGGGAEPGQGMSWPPFTSITWPMMYGASTAEARNR